MTDLVAFLRARLDDDERVAREAGRIRWGGPPDGFAASWTAPCSRKESRTLGDDFPHEGPCNCCVVEGDNIHIYDEGGHDRDQAVHIARWDPARVLAEVQVKRRIIDMYEQQAAQTAREGDNAIDEHRVWILWPALCLLAVPYAAHADYERWWAGPAGASATASGP